MERDEKLRVRLVGSDGRRRYDPASRDRLVAACLKPGVSVSRLALENGINANLLRRWIKDARDAGRFPACSTPAFVPVQLIADRGEPMQGSGLDVAVTGDAVTPPTPEMKRALSAPLRMSASLPNGVNLTLEWSDAEALAAIIGALGHV